MAELVLLRNARALRDGERDYYRSLSQPGWRQADAAAQALFASHFRVARVLCSTALRARETLVPLRGTLRMGEADIVYEPNLYNAGAGVVANIVTGHLQAAPLLIVGHSPGLEQLASWLAGRPLPLDNGHWVRLKVEETLVRAGAKVTGIHRGSIAPSFPALAPAG